MSQQDVEVVDEFFTRALAGDLAAGLELIHPDIVINEGDGLPWGGDHFGHQGLERLIGLIFDPFELDVVSRHVADAGTYVAVRLQCRFRLRATGESVDMPVVELYELRDGLIWRGDIFYKDTKAIADLYNHGLTTDRRKSSRPIPA